MPGEEVIEFIGYSVKDWKAKYYPDGTHSFLSSLGKPFGKIPDDLVICDVCTKEIRQSNGDTDEKVVWTYEGGFEEGNWAVCIECKEHPEGLKASQKLMEEYKKIMGLWDGNNISDAGAAIHTEKEMIEVMEPCLRKSTQKMIDKYGMEKWNDVMGVSIKEGYLKKNKDGQWAVTTKAFIEGIEGSGFVRIVEGEMLDGQRRLKNVNQKEGSG